MVPHAFLGVTFMNSRHQRETDNSKPRGNMFTTDPSQSLSIETAPSQQRGATVTLPCLPPETVVQHLPQQQRLVSAALVPHRWHAAAAAVTNSITASLSPTNEAEGSSLTAWLGEHGAHVIHISITGLPPRKLGEDEFDDNYDQEYEERMDPFYSPPSPALRLQLPLQRLQRLASLRLKGTMLLPPTAAAFAGSSAGSSCSDAAAAAAAGAVSHMVFSHQQHYMQQQCSTTPSPMCALTSLTALHLNNVVMVGFPGGLRSLSGLTALRSLQLQHAVEASATAEVPAEEVHVRREDPNIGLGAALAELTALTHLSFYQFWLKDAALSVSLSRLQQLQEFSFKMIQECSGSGITPAAFAQMPASLTSLELVGAYYCSRSDSDISFLSALQPRAAGQLKRLVLIDSGPVDEAFLVQNFPQLTYLEVAPVDFTWAKVVAPFSGLQQLQELKVPGDFNWLLAGHLKGLPTTLTLLDFTWSRIQKVPLDPSSAPDLCGLSGLKHLILRGSLNSAPGSEISARILENMQHLQHLELSDRFVRRGFVSDERPAPESFLPDLLAVLPELQQLQHLDLSKNMIVPLSRDLQRYSALTASSQLTYLDLAAIGGMVPPEAAQFLFPAGRQLPFLQQLKLGSGHCYERYSALMRAQQASGKRELLDQDGLHSLVSCCPALQGLHIAGAVQPGVQLLGLSRLTALTELVFDEVQLHNTAPKGLPPNVWRQLRDRFTFTRFLGAGGVRN